MRRYVLVVFTVCMMVLQLGFMSLDTVPGSEDFSVLMHTETTQVEASQWSPVNEPNRYSLFVAGGVGMFAFFMRRRLQA